MTVLEHLRTPRVRSLVCGLLPAITLLVLPLWGARAMMIGGLLGLLLLGLTLEFKPGPLDPHGRRAKIGFFCVAAALAAIIAFVLSGLFLRVW
jgi:hypothetical protein